MINRILRLIEAAAKPVTMAIDGPCCSGKSTLASEISKALDCNIIRCDDFFLAPNAVRGDFNIYIDGLIDLLERLPKRLGDTATYEKYCCRLGTYENIEIGYKPITIVEGVYSLAPPLRAFYSFTVWVEVDLDTRLDRLKTRNPHNYDRFVGEWIPREDRYFAKYGVREYADVAVNSLRDTVL